MSSTARGSDPRAVWGWALYDFANSPFTTLVVTFVYATYFTQAIAQDPVQGTALWSRGVVVTALVVAVASPFLGAVADRGALRKRFLAISTSLCVAGSVALFFPRPGQVTAALVAFVVANVAFEMGMVFYNAFLPDVAAPGRIGRVSGYGWGLGYAGGLVALVLALVALVPLDPAADPWFGLSREAGENVRATNLLVAAWYAVFALPLFLWVREDRSHLPPRRKRPSWTETVAEAGRQLAATFRDLKRYRQVVRFLVARLLYNDGLITIFAFGGIYAAGTFGFGVEDIVVFGIVLNVTAGLGAVLMGVLDDRLGGKRTLMLSLAGLSGASLLAVLAPDRTLFWVAGILVGVFAGPNQSASRSLLGRFVPDAKENEFFGFFAFSGKATAFLGPLLLGALTAWSGSQRVGVAIVLVLFAAGAAVLATVDEAEGIAVAQRGVPVPAAPDPPPGA